MGQPTASSVTWPGPNRLICRVGAEPVGQPTEPARLFKNVLCDFQLKTLNALGQCHSRFPGKLKGFTRNSTFCVMGVKHLYKNRVVMVDKPSVLKFAALQQMGTRRRPRRDPP